MNLPATLPGSFREQLMALVPYAIGSAIGVGPEGVNELQMTFRIPDEVVVNASIDEMALKKYGIELEMWRDNRRCDYVVIGPVANMDLQHTTIVLTIRQ